MMSWNSHDPQASKNYATSQANTFSLRTHLSQNNVALVNTHSLLPVPRKLTYKTSDPPLPSNGKPSPASVTPTGNLTPYNNPPKLVPQVPIDPDSDPSSLNSSLF